MKRIFTDDPRVKYVTTSISPDRTRDEISEKLRAYDTYDIYWHWRPEQNDVFVQFVVEEVIDGVPVKVGCRVPLPIIWDKAVNRSPDPKRRVEQVNWGSPRTGLEEIKVDRFLEKGLELGFVTPEQYYDILRQKGLMLTVPDATSEPEGATGQLGAPKQLAVHLHGQAVSSAAMQNYELLIEEQRAKNAAYRRIAEAS